MRREMSLNLLAEGVDYAMEGELLPKQVAVLQRAYPAKIKACFLGYTTITPAQKLQEIRTHAGHPNDWPSSYPDPALLNIINREIAFSQYLMAECATYHLHYFDTSHNFVQTLDQVVAYVRAR